MMLRRVVLGLLIGAVAGFTIFGVLVYRASSVDHVDASEALRRFAAARATAGAGEPLLSLDETGRVVRRKEAPSDPVRPVSHLRVLSYHAPNERLVSVDVPFWFFKLKGPAAQYVFEGTELDLERLQITAADLERHGPGVVIDQIHENGHWLLVWTD